MATGAVATSAIGKGAGEHELRPCDRRRPPYMDITFLDYPNLHRNEFCARGIGEIGLTRFAASVANAVYHATGKRVRELPISVEKLLV